MSKAQLTAVAAISLIGALASSQARAQSAGADAEIAALKQQLRLMEQKLDKLKGRLRPIPPRQQPPMRKRMPGSTSPAPTQLFQSRATLHRLTLSSI
jgi:outer membrane protein TolC